MTSEMANVGDDGPSLFSLDREGRRRGAGCEKEE